MVKREPRRLRSCRWQGRYSAFFGVLCLLPVLIPSSANAQQSGGKATEPGQIQKRIIAPATPEPRVEQVAPPEAPRVRPELVSPGEKFVLVGVEITGSTVYEPVMLSFAYEDFLGRRISLSQIETILGRITQKYRNDGYIISRATAPSQDVESGILRIEVIEGFIERVTFAGAKPGGEDLLQGFAESIKAIRPLRLNGLERYLLLMASAPGLKVFPAMVPVDEDRGAYRLEIRLKHDVVDGFVNLDNRGTTPVGTLQLFVGTNFNSLFGGLERTRIAVFTVPNTPEELLYGEIFHEQILNSEGTRAWLSASRSMVDTGDAGTDAKENSFGTRVTLGVSHPLIRSRETNLSARLQFDALDFDKNSPVAANDFDERLRVVRLGGRLSFNDGIGGANSINLQISKGLDVLHATDQNAFHNTSGLSRTNGRADFIKFKIDVARHQKLAQNLSLQLTASAQKSPHTLLSAEEFAVGGKRFGRAYNPSDISGSDGAAGALEVRYDAPFKPEPLRSLQVYGFYDIGAVWGATFTRQSMASAGGGLRIGLPFRISADLELGWPLTRPITPGESGNHGPRIFFNLLAAF